MFVCVRVRVLHVQYSHAEAGTFGSHKWQVPETYVSCKSHERPCHHQYQVKMFVFVITFTILKDNDLNFTWVSVRVTHITPYVSVPLIGQYWSHFTRARSSNLVSMISMSVMIISMMVVDNMTIINMINCVSMISVVSISTIIMINMIIKMTSLVRSKNMISRVA